MIRPLRQRHRQVVSLLAIALPLLALAALAGRVHAPAPSLDHGEPPAAGDGWRRLAGEEDVAVRVAGPPGARRLEVSGRADAPDLLIYWLPGPDRPAAGEPAAVPAELPQGALLLGGWDGRSPASLALPASSSLPTGETQRPSAGRVVVHSLAYGRPVATAAPAGAGGERER